MYEYNILVNFEYELVRNLVLTLRKYISNLKNTNVEKHIRIIVMMVSKFIV